MNEKEIFEKVRMVIIETLGVSEYDVTRQASFKEDLGADSLDAVELLMAFEEEFQIELSDSDGDQLKMVQDVVDHFLKDKHKS